MGSAVPVAGTRGDVVSENLTLTELRAMQPRLLALSRRCAAAGCRLVFFAFPHCVLGPELWNDSHDLVIGDQDLSDAAPAELEDVTFWSRADYLERPRPVTLGRTRPPECHNCNRSSLCGGHYGSYFEEQGTDELRPMRSEETA